MKKIVLTLLFGISISYAEFIGLTPQQLEQKIQEDVIVIDIRTPPEWKQLGVVPTSKKIMFFDEKGGYDVQTWMNHFSKHVKSPSQPFVLVCRSGNRTTTVGNFLSKQLKFKKVYHLQNGIKSWIRENRKVTK